MRSSCSSTASGPTSTRATSVPRSRSTRSAGGGSAGVSAPSGNPWPPLAGDHAARESTLDLAQAPGLGCGRVRPLAWCSPPRNWPELPDEALVPNAVSRLLVAAAAIPVVLGLVYLGGWWVFGLAAFVAAVALHEFWLLARPLSPLAPAGYVGGGLALAGAELGGVRWMVGGALTTFALAFLLKGISEARQTPTASISATVMGAVWIALGLGFLILIRALADHGRLL